MNPLNELLAAVAEVLRVGDADTGEPAKWQAAFARLRAVHDRITPKIKLDYGLSPHEEAELNEWLTRPRL